MSTGVSVVVVASTTGCGVCSSSAVILESFRLPSLVRCERCLSVVAAMVVTAMDGLTVVSFVCFVSPACGEFCKTGTSSKKTSHRGKEFCCSHQYIIYGMEQTESASGDRGEAQQRQRAQAGPNESGT